MGATNKKSSDAYQCELEHYITIFFILLPLINHVSLSASYPEIELSKLSIGQNNWMEEGFDVINCFMSWTVSEQI